MIVQNKYLNQTFKEYLSYFISNKNFGWCAKNINGCFTHRIIAVLFKQFMYDHVIVMELGASMVPTYNTFTSWKEREKQTERERERHTHTHTHRKREKERDTQRQRQ